jgi:uncharacterized membrane protein YphA (DoxX/SURF4 family)
MSHEREVKTVMPSTARSDLRNPAYTAFLLLRTTFVVAPILAGLDKFFDWMVEWPDYLAPWIDDIIPGSAQQFMYVVGMVEIAAGLLVLAAPWLGAFVVAAWLGGIVINLLTHTPPQYYDIALRDFGLMVGAVALGLLAWGFRRAQPYVEDVDAVTPGRAPAEDRDRVTTHR